VLRFPDVAQHGFVAQQGDAHAFSFGAFSNTHVDDVEPSAISIATTSVSEIAILPSISSFLACLRPFVETDVQFQDCNTTNAHSSTRSAKGQPANGVNR
jgi:hypothetical protein